MNLFVEILKSALPAMIPALLAALGGLFTWHANVFNISYGRDAAGQRIYFRCGIVHVRILGYGTFVRNSGKYVDFPVICFFCIKDENG